MLLALAEAAIERGCDAWTLEVRVSAEGAQELYRRFGFDPAGVRARYYENTEDAIVMWCNDIQGDDYRALLDSIRVESRSAMVRRRVPDPISVDESTLVLGIETSCDETAAALVLGGYDVVSSVVSTQVDLHADFGGVVPEIASRAHLDVLNPVIARAIVEAGVDEQRIDAVACTVGPGLIGALLVGVSAAKALAMAWDVPFVGVNHMEAHLYAASLEDPTLEFPLLVLLVSGGHTMLVEMQDHGRYRLLGQTIDDAAGEAFDKVARFLDLGYPGGPAIDRAALDGDPEAIRFPRAIMDDGLRLLVQRAEDGGHELRPQASRRVVGGRRCVVPGGGRRRAGHQGPPGCGRGRGDRHRARWWGRGELAAARGDARRVRASTGSRGSCRAGRCAPTTPR